MCLFLRILIEYVNLDLITFNTFYMVNVQKTDIDNVTSNTEISEEIIDKKITIMDIIMAWPSEKIDLLDQYRCLISSDDTRL